MSTSLVGVDIGGTFTDLVVSEDGQLRIHKLFSTPSDPAQAMLAGLDALTNGRAARVAHGSTVATNAILERKGARTALITTHGFRDVLWLARQNRPDIYALYPQISPPLIPREWSYEVTERLDHHGAVLTPLDMMSVDAALDAIQQHRIDAVAICLLYSFLNPAHERQIRQRILERGLLTDDQIALSSDVLPEFREYERASTVALEAYVRPVMSRYLQHLEAQLPAGTPLRVMKSDGGVISAHAASQQAIQTALSGPAAGVIGAFHLAKLAGFDRVITLDMGGTSTDVALCPGDLMRRTDREIDGLPLRIRVLDIETVGAGGGSIARVDAGGALRVGPESAGAVPGSIIYGRGGTQVTVSDANAILGRLDASHFLGGTVTLHMDAARAVLQTMAQPLGFTVEQTARGILDIANVNIDRAVRRVSIARGYDPREFTLVAFGGAGPLHACEVADRLAIPRVLIPRYPGVLCAFGLLVADVAIDYSRHVLGLSGDDLPALLAALTAQATADLAREGIPPAQHTLIASVDMRYRGQAYELTIPYTSDLTTAFHQAHARQYGHALPDRPVEMVTLRLQAIGSIDKPVITPEPLTASDARAAIVAVKHTADGELTCYDRDRLSPGMDFAGAALIFQLDSTAFIPSGWHGHVDGFRNLVLQRAK
ncbi:MAG: hydantoinase/oxoprolinase family protein [Anaerolineae bacterium]|nr:hydantoinase/oxoprolinase family protein [Anaerolineae bacterium]